MSKKRVLTIISAEQYILKDESLEKKVEKGGERGKIKIFKKI